MTCSGGKSDLTTHSLVYTATTTTNISLSLHKHNNTLFNICYEVGEERTVCVVHQCKLVENSNLLTKSKKCVCGSLFQFILTPKRVCACVFCKAVYICCGFKLLPNNKTELSMNLIIYSSLCVAFN